MPTERMSNLKVEALFAKVLAGEQMSRADALKFGPDHGVIGDVNPERSPRQVSLAFVDSLSDCGVSAEGARSNLLLRNPSGGQDRVAPGALLVGEHDVAIRVTMVCEPCKYGADLAGVANRRFRGIRRYLGVVVREGVVVQGSELEVYPAVYPSSPDSFVDRASWALESIPRGRFMTSMQFLLAIGAGKAYARALPGWLRKAQDAGKPVHRVLTAQLSAGSWEPLSLELLRTEGVRDVPRGPQTFDLMSVLWFENAAQHSRTRIKSF
ncbi:hypothetical protein AB0H12_37755 [Actinosynnema sp. NPDC023794]